MGNAGHLKQKKAETSLKFSQTGNSASVQPEEGDGKSTAVVGGKVGIVYLFLKDKQAVPACDLAYLKSKTPRSFQITTDSWKCRSEGTIWSCLVQTPAKSMFITNTARIHGFV